jgi:hypothetical protein
MGARYVADKFKTFKKVAWLLFLLVGLVASGYSVYSVFTEALREEIVLQCITTDGKVAIHRTGGWKHLERNVWYNTKDGMKLSAPREVICYTEKTTNGN